MIIYPKTTVGVTVGKFMPPHIGHQFMIDFGSRMLDKMIVIVSGSRSDHIDVNLRVSWLKKHYENTNVEIVFIDSSKVPDDTILEKDKNGTVIDQSFWDSWKQIFLTYAPDATHFVSSDMYGKKAAEVLNIKWLPVDIERETLMFNMHGVSATFIRNNDSDISYKLLMSEPKEYYRKVIAVIGPESTGKSTIVKKLAKEYNTIGIHEFGRTLTIANNNIFVDDDFFLISKAQDQMIKWAKQTSQERIIFTDTEAFVTYLYGKIYMNKEFDAIKEFAINQSIDCYLIVKPLRQWVDDGLRICEDYDKRLEFFNELVNFCVQNNFKYYIVDEQCFENNYRKALQYVEMFIKEIHDE